MGADGSRLAAVGLSGKPAAQGRESVATPVAIADQLRLHASDAIRTDHTLGEVSAQAAITSC
jgi:hypothetical protein